MAIPTHLYDDVIKWKHFPRYWPFVWGIHRSPVNSPHKGQWRGALMFPLICDWINGWVNNYEAGDLRRHQAHYDVTVMFQDDTLERITSRKAMFVSRLCMMTFIQWDNKRASLGFSRLSLQFAAFSCDILVSSWGNPSWIHHIECNTTGKP